MKICILNGSPKGKRSNSYYLNNLFIDELKKKEDVTVEEFFASKDFPDHCTGCFTCIVRDEKKCPHRSVIEPIEKSILEADAIFFLTPVYVMSLSGRMKTLLDHFGYWFVIHRPPVVFQNKVALIISTTVGDGTRNAINSIKRVLRYWGIPKIFSYGAAMYTMTFEELKKNNPKKYNKIEKDISNMANRFYKTYQKRDKQRNTLFFNFYRWFMRRFVKQFDESNIDKQYWLAQGWIRE